MNLKIENVQFDRDNALDADVVAMILGLKTSKKEDHSILVKTLQNLEGVSYLEEL